MSTATLPLPRPVSGVEAPPPGADEPVALLQLDARVSAEAASAVYREVRRGRRVVAVASGGADAAARLAEALEAIGVACARPGPGQTRRQTRCACARGGRCARADAAPDRGPGPCRAGQAGPAGSSRGQFRPAGAQGPQSVPRPGRPGLRRPFGPGGSHGRR